MHLLNFSEKYKNYTDSEIVSAFRETSDNAFIGILYERFGHLVLGLGIKYLKNKDEAQDAVIHIFSSLITDLKKHQVTFFKSWLYVYSKNYCFMQLRKRQSALKRELELNENVHLIMDFNDPDHLEEREKQIVLMETAIAQLTADQKLCIELFYLNNKSYNEIVTITGYTNNDVKSYIQNGKRNLKLKMEALSNEQTN